MIPLDHHYDPPLVIVKANDQIILSIYDSNMTFLRSNIWFGTKLIFLFNIFVKKMI